MFKFVYVDIKNTIRKMSCALFFAWSDLKARYRRSVLGPLWLVFGTAISVAGLGFLWSTLLNTDKTLFIPSLTTGLVIWQLIAGCITEGSSVLIRNAAIIRNLNIPYLFFPVQLLLKQLINFGHNFLVVIAILLLFPPPLNANQFLLIPGIILLVGNLLWITLILAMLGARFRDLEPLIAALMPMLFFLSPVIYRPSHLGIKEYIMWLNPFSYFISLIRDPIQGIAPPLFVYETSLIMLVIGWLSALWLLDRKYKRIAFWV